MNGTLFATPTAIWGRFTAWAKTRDAWVLGGLLLVSLALRLIFAPFPGFFNDLNTYIRWGVDVNSHFRDFYSFAAPRYPANYPPLTVYIYWVDMRFYALVQHLMGLGTPYDTAMSWHLAVVGKLPAIFADLGIIASIFVVARRTLSLGGSLFFAASFAVSPAAIFNSSIWGQTDAMFTLCVLLALYAAIARRPIAAGIFFGLAVMLKPQPVVFIPVLLVYLWKDDVRGMLKAAAATVGVSLIIFLPYLLPPNETFAFVNNVRANLLGSASPTGYNLWWAAGLQRVDPSYSLLGPLTVQVVGWGIFVIVLGLVCLGIWRAHTAVLLLVGAALVAYAFFLFTPGQHERYSYPVLVLFLAATIWQRRNWLWYVLTTFFCFLNMGIVAIVRYRLYGQTLADLGAFFETHLWATRLISFLNVAVFCVTFGLFLWDSLLRDEVVARNPALAARLGSGAADIAQQETVTVKRLRQTPAFPTR